MRTIAWYALAATVVLWGAVRPLHAADVGTDRAGAIIVFPWIQVQSSVGKDTVLELAMSPTGVTPITAFCYLQDANSHCSNNPSIVCETSADCGAPCDPGWLVNDFRVDLSPNQPITWRASQGLASVPLSGGSIPPVAEDPFVGSLVCIAADDGLPPIPNERNELRGSASFEQFVDGVQLDVAKYDAVGVEAIPGANDGDLILRLGGPSAEYAACPNTLVLNHFAEGAIEPVASASNVHTRIALWPCAQDVFDFLPGTGVVQFLVSNEFEQRFSTSTFVNGLKVTRMSRIDSTQEERSIFSFNVQGTLVLQTRMTGVPKGVFAVAVEDRDQIADPTVRYTAGVDVHMQGDNANEARLGQQPCGDGVLDPGEECDDGNNLGGDCCPSGCSFGACAIPGRSVLVLKDKAPDTRDKLIWKWRRGTPFLASSFGDPLTTTGYRFCLWDDNTVAVQASVAGGGTCPTDPCWETIGSPGDPRGYKYKNPDLNPTGTRFVKLKAGNGNAATWLGKGTDLPLPGPVSGTRYFNQSSQVRAVLFRDDDGVCWQSSYTTNVKNQPDLFKARVP